MSHEAMEAAGLTSPWQESLQGGWRLWRARDTRKCRLLSEHKTGLGGGADRFSAPLEDSGEEIEENMHLPSFWLSSNVATGMKPIWESWQEFEIHTVYFRPKKMSKSEEGSSLGAIFRSKWELLSKAHKVILAARIPIETDILILWSMCEGLDFNPSHIDQWMRMSVSNPHRGQATSLQINKVKDKERKRFYYLSGLFTSKIKICAFIYLKW